MNIRDLKRLRWRLLWGPRGLHWFLARTRAVITSRLWPIRQCPDCGRWMFVSFNGHPTIATRRMNTAYCDESQNWTRSCEECYERTIAMYAGQWAEYYAGVL